MLKYLQNESEDYFKTRSFSQTFATLSTPRQRANFYTMLVTSHLASPSDAAVTYLGESSAAHSLDPVSLMSALWGVSLQVGANSEEAKRLTTLVGLLHARSIVQRNQLLTDLPDWVVQGAGLVEAAASDRRLARVYTKINYEQSKYSILRQNNEGYAKVTLLLVNLRDSHDINLTWQRMLDLVGNFDLDPDRILDLVVEARVHNHTTKGYLRLLDNFRKESIAAVIGNKLRLCRGKPIEGELLEKMVYVGPLDGLDGQGEPVQQVVSPHLISLCAELIKRNALSFQDLLAYLEPGDHVIRHVNSKRVELAMQKIKECFTLNMEELDETEKAKMAIEQNLKFEGQMIHSTKLALISQLVRLNDWTDFEAAWAPLKDKIDLLLYQPLLRNLLDLIEWVIEPLNQATSYHRFFSTEKSFKFITNGSPKQHPRITSLDSDGLASLQNLLKYVGKYMGLRCRLFIKICRLLKREAKEGRGQSVKGIIQDQLILGSCVVQNNAAMAMQLFELLDCYEYQFRYDCYMRVYRGGMSGCPIVARIFESIKRRQNIIVNNLSKENKKLFIRKISKLTHNQALPVFYWIIRRIVMEDYEAVVPEIVAVIINCSPLTLDMAIFTMLYTLNQSKDPPVNAKTHQCYPWFKNVTTFISNFFRKYLQTDIQPVFDYIIMKTSGKLSELDDDELPGDLLKLLHEILNKMHGSVMISEVNKTKYDAIAAGPRLQAEILELTSEVRAAKKSKVFLQKFFWQKNVVHQDGYSLAFNLLVLLAQKRAQLFTKCYIDDIKIVGEIFDEYSMLIVQIVRVLLYQAQDYSHYAQLLPADPVRVLLRDYKLPLEIVCEVVRPGVKHIAMMTPQQWGQLTSDFKAAYTECLADDKYLVKSSRANQKWSGLLSAYKQKVLQYIPISFFTAFWFLTLDSVYFPAKSYSEKIEDLKKKIEPTKRGDKINEKQMERMKTLLEKLTKEQQAQRKKYNDTLSPQNLKKLQVQMLQSNTDKSREAIFIFAEQLVQTCLLPRMMLDRTEALYCVKFTIEMIKANKMAVTKCIRLLTFIIEYVMGYLPFTTHRQASNCISVFLAEILAIFNNWNDSVKLKQDLSRILGVQESSGRDNYPKMKDYLIKLFERVGNTLRGVKQEPYLIKNCLYILEKVDSIPSYKEQADQLAQHMNELKELFPTVDMRTIMDRQIAILTQKKNELPDKPEQKKSKPEQSKPVPQKEAVNVVKITNFPINQHLTTISQTPATPIFPSNQHFNLSAPVLSNPITSNNPASNGQKKDSEPKTSQLKPKAQTKPEQKQPQRIEERHQQKPKSRFTEKPTDKKSEARAEQPKRQDRRPQIKIGPINPINPPQQGSRFTEQKIQPRPATIAPSNPPKTVKQMRQQMMQKTLATQSLSNTQPVAQASLPQVVPTSTSQAATIVENLSSNLATNPRQQEVTIRQPPPLTSQKPASSATIEQTNLPLPTQTIPIKVTPPPPQQLSIITKNEKEEKAPQKRENNNSNNKQKIYSQQKNSPNPLDKEKKEKPSPTPERRKDNRDNNKKEYPRDKDQREPRDSTRDNRDNRDRQTKDRQAAKQKYSYNPNPKLDDRPQSRKQDKRDRSREDKDKQRQKQRERERQKQRDKKERDRGYDKYRQRDYGRR